METHDGEHDFSLYIQVNRDFSSIFHTLLPNARAKLEPPEGGTVLDGLVMKVNKYFDTHIYLYITYITVGFGDCWKDIHMHIYTYIHTCL